MIILQTMKCVEKPCYKWERKTYSEGLSDLKNKYRGLLK
jgi:hypothetical protein